MLNGTKKESRKTKKPPDKDYNISGACRVGKQSEGCGGQIDKQPKTKRQMSDFKGDCEIIAGYYENSMLRGKLVSANLIAGFDWNILMAVGKDLEQKAKYQSVHFDKNELSFDFEIVHERIARYIEWLEKNNIDDLEDQKPEEQ